MINPTIEQAKSAVDSFELPCGYLDPGGNLHTHVEVREITGDEEEVLGAKNMPALKKMNRVLAQCTTAIGDIRDSRQIAAIIPDLTQGDRVYLLFAIRRASLGDEFPFTTVCPQCEKKSNLTVSLADLTIKKMPNPLIRTYDITLERSKAKISMRVLTGRGEEQIAKASSSGNNAITMAMLARVESMNGYPASIDDLKALGMADRNQIRNEWEDREGGVDTEVEVQCLHCDFEFKSEIDLSSEGFFNPLALLKKWKSSAS
jgi:hypothetical protein